VSDRLTGDGRGSVALSTGLISGRIPDEGRVPVAENHGCGYGIQLCMVPELLRHRDYSNYEATAWEETGWIYMAYDGSN
jgi:hypothetical protein